MQEPTLLLVLGGLVITLGALTAVAMVRLLLSPGPAERGRHLGSHVLVVVGFVALVAVAVWLADP